MDEKELLPVELTNETIESMIYEIRAQKVMLDFELAKIYGYETRYLNRQVKNNIRKFPEEFMFQLSEIEVKEVVKCKNFTSPKGFFSGQEGGVRKLPYAFTEQGIYMLMTVLKGDFAKKQNIPHKCIMSNVRFVLRLFRRLFRKSPISTPQARLLQYFK